MLEKCLQLRQQEAIDTILSRPLPEIVRCHLHASYDEGWLPNPDMHGRPVYILRGGKTGSHLLSCVPAAGRLFTRGTVSAEPGLCQPSGERLHKLFTPPAADVPWELADITESFMHWHLQMMEWMNKVGYHELCGKAGKLINKFVMINDLNGMSTKGVSQIMKFVDIMKRMSAMDQLLYPEGLGVMYFVNAPALFSGPWSVIKGLMSQVIPCAEEQYLHVISYMCPPASSILTIHRRRRENAFTLFDLQTRQEFCNPLFLSSRCRTIAAAICIASQHAAHAVRSSSTCASTGSLLCWIWRGSSRTSSVADAHRS
eukprot:SAG31_NODE_2110_length_6426_cov_6.371898_6_plen_314_part_00